MDTQSHCPVSVSSFSEPLLSIGSPSVLPLSLTADASSGATSYIAQGESYRQSTTISMLTENVLLEIFVFFRDSYGYPGRTAWDWHLLVHVCRRWRQIIFASPHRLDLQILCTHSTPVRKNLNIWPAFPLAIYYSGRSITPNDEDNVIAALEHSDRVRYLGLVVNGKQLGKMATVMQDPFPVLTHLDIFFRDIFGNVPVLPAEFLGGSAPCLQEIHLGGIPLLSLPTLLLSTSDLVTLILHHIPPTGHISSAAMVACLVLLPRLENLIIKFELAVYQPDRTHPPPNTRTVLPALTSFEFQGASQYLEDLVSPIDGPQLNWIRIHYLDHSVDSQVPQLSNFFDRSVGPKITPFTLAVFHFFVEGVTFDMYHHMNHLGQDKPPAHTLITCEGIDCRFPHLMAQVLNQFSTIISTVVHLRLDVLLPEGLLERGGDEWLHFFNQFPTVQALHVSSPFARHVAVVLENTTGAIVTEVLPSLDLIYLDEQPTSSIEKFIAARRLSGRPVTVIDTETDFDERLESYGSE